MKKPLILYIGLLFSNPTNLRGEPGKWGIWVGENTI